MNAQPNIATCGAPTAPPFASANPNSATDGNRAASARPQQARSGTPQDRFETASATPTSVAPTLASAGALAPPADAIAFEPTRASAGASPSPAVPSQLRLVAELTALEQTGPRCADTVANADAGFDHQCRWGTEVRLGTGLRERVLIDTGADAVTVPVGRIEENAEGLQRRGDATAGGHYADVAVSHYRAPLSIPGQPGEAIDVDVLGVPGETAVLGTANLSDYVVDLDFKDNAMRVCEPGAIDPSALGTQGLERIPEHLVHFTPDGRIYLAVTLDEASPVACLLDTGSAHAAVMPSRVAGMLMMSGSEPVAEGMVSSVTLGGQRSTEAAFWQSRIRIGDLDLGTHRVTTPLCGDGDVSQGFLGMPCFHQHRVLIDYPNQTLYIG